MKGTDGMRSLFLAFVYGNEDRKMVTLAKVTGLEDGAWLPRTPEIIRRGTEEQNGQKKT